MALDVTVQPAACGALVRGIDLTRPLSPTQSSALREAWLEHQVLAFPEQALSIDDLERFASTIGPFGPDPYFESIPGHPHVAQVKREADETSTIFADTWHSDWSFLASPPAGTLLYGNVIPPVGGDTLFANQYEAWSALPEALRSTLQQRRGVHSARRGYSRQGRYGEADKGRSMAIRYDDSALATQTHPIARRHPETGRTALFVSPGYTIGIEGLPDGRSQCAAARAVHAPGQAAVRVPPSLGQRHAGVVGQPLPGACRHRRLPGTSPVAASHHGRRTAGSVRTRHAVRCT
jgi:taurine dioxygenase